MARFVKMFRKYWGARPFKILYMRNALCFFFFSIGLPSVDSQGAELRLSRI